MKSLTDPLRITWSCPFRWLFCVTVMGALSPGLTFDGPDLGLGKNSIQPDHWKNNSTPSTLYCRTGYSLQIFPNRTVRGTLEPTHQQYVNFTFTTVGKKTVAIRQVETGFYLCMHLNSVVYARIDFLEEDCEWMEIVLSNWYNSYQHKHHMRKRNREKGVTKKRYYLAFNADGTMRHGDMSRKSKKSAQFLKKSRNGPKDFEVVPATKPPSKEIGTVEPVTGHPAATTTKRQRPLKLGCKGLKSKYCQRIRKLLRKGKRLRHAKRHRRCMPRRLSNDKQTLNDRRKLRRLQRTCRRIRRKRLERRRQSQTHSENGEKQRTSMLRHLTTRIPHRTYH